MLTYVLILGYERCQGPAATARRGRVPQAHDGSELAILQSCNGGWGTSIVDNEITWIEQVRWLPRRRQEAIRFESFYFSSVGQLAVCLAVCI